MSQPPWGQQGQWGPPQQQYGHHGDGPPPPKRPTSHLVWWLLLGLLLTLVLAHYALRGPPVDPQVEWAARQADRARARANEERAISDAKSAAAQAKVDAELDAAAALRFAHDEDVARYRGMGQAGRLAAIKSACRDSECDELDPAFLEAAESDAERASMRATFAALSRQAHAEAERSRAADAILLRKLFADDLDSALLAKHMNPDGVSADGKILRVRGWFCSRQFVHDFALTQGDAAKTCGFVRVECSTGYSSAWQDL